MRPLPSNHRASRVGEWDLLLQLGDSVHLARRRGPQKFARLGALRMLPAAPPDAERLERDLSRASAAGHPLLCSIEDFGDDVARYVVTQYVEGGSLDELLASGRPALEVAVTIAVDACAALQALHATRDAAGGALVHGAITAASLIVGADGRTRLTDLGLQSLGPRLEDPSVAGVHLAPEARRGEAPSVRGDVFSLGTVLYALLGGRLEGDDSGERPLLSALDVDVPPALGEVVARATAPDPEHRFASAAALGTALDHAARPAPHRRVGAWVDARLLGRLAERRAAVAAVEPEPPSSERPRRARSASKIPRPAVAMLAIAALLFLSALAYRLRASSPALAIEAAEEPTHAPPGDEAPVVQMERPTEDTATPSVEIDALPSASAAAAPARRRPRRTEPLTNPYR